MIKMTIRISAALLLAAVIFSCGGSGGRTTDGESAGMRYARYLSISDCGSYTVADITNPWDTARLLHRYILVPQDSPLPQDIPQGTLVRTPIDRPHHRLLLGTCLDNRRPRSLRPHSRSL